MTNSSQQIGSPVEVSPLRPASSPLDIVSQLSSARGTPQPSPAHSARGKSKRRSSLVRASTPVRPQTSPEPTSSTPIRTIDAAASQSIRAAHTILDAAAIVKELVENALDAHAKRIDVRLRGKAALDSIVVSDDGAGVASVDHETLCLPSTTSKLRAGSDFSSLSTFGFRGEALAAIRYVCASLTVVTRARNDPAATSLSYNQDGSLARSTPAARPVGTTVTVTRVFHALPVRRKNAIANQAREIARCVSVVQALAIIATHTRIELRLATDVKVSSSPHSLLPSFSPSVLSLTALRTTTRSVLGSRATSSLIDIFDNLTVVTVPASFRSLNVDESEENSDPSRAQYSCMGLVSKASLAADGSGGRARSSYHYMYINERPVDLPRLVRAANEVYRRATGLTSASPTLVVNFTLPPWSCDVNLAPDKRHVLIHDEDALVAGFVRLLERIWIPTTTAPIPLQLTQTTLTASLAPVPQSAQDSFPELAVEANCKIESPVPCSSSPPLNDSRSPSNFAGCNVLPNENFCNSEISEHTPIHSPLRPKMSAGSVSPDPVAKAISFDSNQSALEKHQVSDAPGQFILKAGVSELKVEKICPEFEKATKECEPDEPLISSPSTWNALVSKGSNQISDRPPLTPMEVEEIFSPADFANCFRRNDRLKRRRSRDSEVSAEKANSDQTSTRNNDFKAMLKHQGVNEGPNRRSVFEYVGRRAKRVSSKQGGAGDDKLRVEDCDVRRTLKRSAASLDACILESARGVNDVPASADVNVVMDGSSLEVALSQIKPVFTLHTDWDSICNPEGEKSIAWDKLEREKINQDVEKSLFCKASITECTKDGETPNHQQEAADRELSRLFRQEWFTQLRVIGQFNRGFIIGQLNNNLFIIDQHASDEKYNFEDLQRNTQIEKQRLVQPQDLEFSAEDELLVVQYSNALKAGGFDIRYDAKQPPTRRLRLHAQPVSKHTMFVESDLQDIVHFLRSGAIPASVEVLRPPRVRAMFATRACRKSIMIGTSLHRREMYSVLRNMATIAHPWTCPHGRPTMRHLCTLPPDEIDS